jgi:sugar lactone lactonase YvrE
VRRYTPDGRLDTEVRVPATCITSCCFGGPAGDRLFITSARRDLDDEGLAREPGAGSVWVADPGVGGPPPVLWAG